MRKQLLQSYIDAGLRLVKIKPGDKKPVEKAWQKNSATLDTIHPANNVGVIFENGLVDLDFDTPEARKLSGFFFGNCPSFRRSSLPADEPGHRLVRCTNHPGGKVAFTLSKDDAPLMGKANILELRSSTAKKGHQTVVPPSRYYQECWRQMNGTFQPDAPFDELVWNEPFNADSIPTMEWEAVKRAGALLALSAIALHQYPGEGRRDDFCLSFAGALLAMGVEASEADDLVAHVAKMAGDDERRSGKATRTEERKADGVQVNGLPAFCALLESDGLEKTVRRWFGQDVRNKPGKQKAKPAPEGSIPVYMPRHIFTQLLEAKMIERKVPIYRRFSKLVTPVLLSDDMELDGVTYPRDTVLLKAVDAKWVRFTCDEFGITFCNDKGELDYPHMSDLEDLFVKVELSSFPVIDGTSTTPTLYRNESGYDPVSRRVLVFRFGAFPDAPMQPSRADAEAALERLRHPVREFTWKHNYDEAVWLAGMLSASVRTELRDCYVFGFNANKASSGKTILCRCVAYVACGGMPPTMSYTDNQIEFAKKLFAAMYQGATAIFVDNVPRGMPVDSDTLNQIVTSEVYEDRILGVSEMGQVSTRVLLLFTGNDLTLSGDLVTRGLVCTVDPPSAEPDTLKYNFLPDEIVKQNRGQFVVDCLTVLRAYIHAGRPGEDDLTAGRLKSFDLIRGALVWLGQPDPLLSLADVKEENPEMEDRYELLNQVISHYHEKEQFRARDFAEKDGVAKRLAYGLDVGDPAKIIGRKLSRHRDCEMGGMVIRSRKSPGNVGLIWWYERTKEESELFADAAAARLRRETEAEELAEAKRREFAA